MPSPGAADDASRADPRVAVVIPCFNDGTFVTEAVESALAQEPCEIIVVDDGSDDEDTIRTLDRLPESVRVVHQSNQGLAAARMAGVAASSARYIQPLDADDRLAAGVLSKLADALDANPEADAAWGTTIVFGARESTSIPWVSFDPWRLTHLNEVPNTLLVRREALLAVGGWDLDRRFEDWDFNMKGAESGWVGMRIPALHCHYREHPTPRMFDEATREYDALIGLLRERHSRLFTERRGTRRHSRSRLVLKLAWSIIEALPLISPYTRAKLYYLTRDSLEPQMRPSAVPSFGLRLANKLKGYLHLRSSTAATGRG